ncbi:helix-turn-helix domain-containing protein [Inquilinus sp. CA228]|uniref:helix-turn-helix domain-containing protein n=1 Tax=Inquilinus sp. CA228 TaxID=3455609 RepID=UPI003F8D224B
MAIRGSDRQRRRKTISEDGPDPVDVHVGTRLRQRRTLMGMSQEKLAAAFGVSFQQIQKYERGANRVSASRLHQLTRILNVPVGYFFEGMTDVPQNGSAHPAHDNEMVASRETLELVRAYYRIEDPTVRRRLVDLLRSLGPEAASEH